MESWKIPFIIPIILFLALIFFVLVRFTYNESQCAHELNKTFNFFNTYAYDKNPSSGLITISQNNNLLTIDKMKDNKRNGKLNGESLSDSCLSTWLKDKPFLE